MKKNLVVVVLLAVFVALSGLGFLAGCANKGSGPDASGKTPAEPPEVVMENDAFKIYEPAPNTEVQDEVFVKGLARVWEGTVQYEVEDGHNILDTGFVTASQGAPEWGDFEIAIKIGEVANDIALVILYEESAKDGSRLNELVIPVQVTR